MYISLSNSGSSNYVRHSYSVVFVTVWYCARDRTFFLTYFAVFLCASQNSLGLSGSERRANLNFAKWVYCLHCSIVALRRCREYHNIDLSVVLYQQLWLTHRSEVKKPCIWARQEGRNIPMDSDTSSNADNSSNEESEDERNSCSSTNNSSNSENGESEDGDISDTQMSTLIVSIE